LGFIQTQKLQPTKMQLENALRLFFLFSQEHQQEPEKLENK